MLLLSKENICRGERKKTQRKQDDVQMHKDKMSHHLFFLLIKIVLSGFMSVRRK